MNDIWSKLKYFKKTENWGSPNKISEDLLLELDRARGFIGERMIITSGTQGVHTVESYHYQGLAVDFVTPDSVSWLNFFISLSRFSFKGIGYYPDWYFDGKKVGGFHVDLRPTLKRAYWIAKKTTRGQQYLPFDEKHLRMFKLL